MKKAARIGYFNGHSTGKFLPQKMHNLMTFHHICLLTTCPSLVTEPSTRLSLECAQENMIATVAQSNVLGHGDDLRNDGVPVEFGTEGGRTHFNNEYSQPV